MKIVHTNKAYAPLIGGIETTLTILAEGLSKVEGIENEVLVCNNLRSFRSVRRTINGVAVTYVPSWGSIASLPISPSYPLSLAAMKGDILHIHEPFPLADLAILSFPGILKNFSHVLISWYGEIVRQRWALPLYGPMIHKVLRKVEKILVSAPGLIDVSDYLPPYRDRCEVIPLGLNLEWTESAGTRVDRVNQIRRECGTPLILFVGRLVYYKGLSYLVEAMSMVRDATLVIIGSGPLRGRLLADIARFGLEERIRVFPHVPEDELHAFYEACDMLVLPSTERSESFGLVQVEAMACGKPAVSTRIGTGVPFVNLDGVTGLTVPPRDSVALAEALEKLVADPDLRVSYGKNAKERAFREFSARQMIDRTKKVYEKLMKS
jgi:glycosyltransferase involved in cell wall biosynthesis